MYPTIKRSAHVAMSLVQEKGYVANAYNITDQTTRYQDAFSQKRAKEVMTEALRIS